MASINTNIAAYYAQNNLKSAADKAQSSIARLSSGNAIVRASDNVSGLAIGTVLKTNVSTLQTASSNASQGTTLLQIADGALSSLGDILQRQKALAVQANSGTLSDTERGYLNQEFQALTSEYNQIVSTTNFNGVNLLDGSLAVGAGAKTQTVATSGFSAVAKSGSTVDTSVLTGGAGAFAVTTVGTTSKAQSLIGSLANASVTGIDDPNVSANIFLVANINGVSYRSASFSANATGTDIAFTGTDGTVFTLDIANQGVASPTQTDANTIASKVQTELQKLSVYQTKAISKTATDSGSIVANDTNNTVLDGLDGDDFKLTSTSFDTATGAAPSIGNFKVDYANGGASISVDVNGHTYTKVLNDLTGFKSTAASATTGNGTATGHLDLTSVDDSNSILSIDFSQLTGDISLASTDDASKLQDALNSVFGSGSSGGLQFQVGTSSSDTIGISIKNANSASVFKDASGVSQSLDISTQAGAVTASDVIDNAIQSITSVRSDVGALQERFGYVSDTLGVSIQNLDAARSQFLDTDVSAESTKYATEQVQQQAAISVLAQANQLPQNLLKLLGQ